MELSDPRVDDLGTLYHYFMQNQPLNLSETLTLIGRKDAKKGTTAPSVMWAMPNASNGLDEMSWGWGGENIIVAESFEVANLIHIKLEREQEIFVSDILYIPCDVFTCQDEAASSSAERLCSSGNVLHDSRKDTNWIVDASNPYERIVIYRGESLDEHTSRQYLLSETYRFLDELAEAETDISQYARQALNLESQYIWESLICGILLGLGMSDGGIDYELYSSTSRYDKLYQKMRFGWLRIDNESLHDSVKDAVERVQHANDIMNLVTKSSKFLDVRTPLLLPPVDLNKQSIAKHISRYCSESGVADFIETANAGVPIEDILA